MSNLQKQKDRFKEITGYNDVERWHKAYGHITAGAVWRNRPTYALGLSPQNYLSVRKSSGGVFYEDFSALFKHIIDKTPYQPESVEVTDTYSVFWIHGKQKCGSCVFRKNKVCRRLGAFLNSDETQLPNCPCKVQKREVDDGYYR